MTENEKEETYVKYIRMIHPNYDSMSPERKEIVEMQLRGLIRYAPEIDLLFNKMKDPNDPLYQKGASDKDIVNIAALYANIDEKTNSVQVETGKMERGGPYFDTPIPEYKTTEAKGGIKDTLIELAVKDYNAQHLISRQNIVSGVKKYKLDANIAKDVSEVLKQMSQKEKAEPETEQEMEV